MTDLDSDLPRPPTVRLDLTPLVDVIFLLLIFFMVSTTFRDEQAIELDLPEASTAAATESNELRVRLDKNGDVYFKGSKIEVGNLEAAAKQALDGAKRKFFAVEADSSAQHGTVVAVMDALRRAGAEGLTVATEASGP